VPAPDHVFAPAGFLLLVLVYLVPAHAHGLEQAAKSEVNVDGTKLDRFGTVDVQSKVPDIDPASLHTQLRALPGGVYSAVAIDKTVETMTIEISKRGHAFVQVRPALIPTSQRIPSTWFSSSRKDRTSMSSASPSAATVELVSM
jgi:hypothetical protein